ncbi:hypothetical protein EBB07_25415 [Paenibacillaceae bacterium]|nr:hypothetical protein EBB07_25415 [Paenibacillaceae bacterium]
MKPISLPFPSSMLDFSEKITAIVPIHHGRHYQSVYILEVNTAEKYVMKIKKTEYAGSLYEEAERLNWMKGKLPVPEVIRYYKEHDKEYLVMSYIEGCVGSEYQHLDGEKSLGFVLGEGLRKIHRVGIDQCPFKAFLPENLISMVKNNIEHHFDQVTEVINRAFPDETLEQLMDFLEINRPLDNELVFTHGDYGSGNVIIHNGELNAFIDVDGAGVSDPYYDIYYLIKSLTQYSDRHEEVPGFLKGYGINELDQQKMKFHQIIDVLLL